MIRAEKFAEEAGRRLYLMEIPLRIFNQLRESRTVTGKNISFT